MKPITPTELTGIDTSKLDLDDKERLIKFINNRLQEDPLLAEHIIQAIGILRNAEGFQDRANEVLNQFRKAGWKISEFIGYWSFQTRIEFKISKA